MSHVLFYLGVTSTLLFHGYRLLQASQMALVVKNSPLATHSSILAWRIPMDRGAWRATVHGVTKSRTQLKQLSTQAQITSNKEQ